MAQGDDVYIPKVAIDKEGKISVENLNAIIRRIFQVLYSLEGRTGPSTIRNSLSLVGIPEPDVSNDGEGTIYFDIDSGTFRVSEDGSAYTGLGESSVTVEGTTNEVEVAQVGDVFTVGLPDEISLGAGGLATGATTGFPHISQMAGKPTGTPSGISGHTPIVSDSTDHTLFIRDSGASEWLGVYDRSTISPAQITADQNDYDPGSYGYIWRLTSDANRNISGIAGHNSVMGRRIYIFNVGGFNIVLLHDDLGSLAPNRILCIGGAAITIFPDRAALLFYDSTTSRWRAFNV